MIRSTDKMMREIWMRTPFETVSFKKRKNIIFHLSFPCTNLLPFPANSLFIIILVITKFVISILNIMNVKKYKIFNQTWLLSVYGMKCFDFHSFFCTRYFFQTHLDKNTGQIMHSRDEFVSEIEARRIHHRRKRMQNI